MNSQNNLFKDKTILVTGGLGSIGSAIVNKLKHKPVQEIIVADNRETALFYAKTNSRDRRVRFEFLDVTKSAKIDKLTQGVDMVFHAAALKHVIVSEDNPWETIETNVIGTRNVINASLKNDVSKMILISTDKAVNPTNVMGATKLLGEKLIMATVNSNQTSKTDFGIIRFGNVLHSRGSVLEIWDQQISKGNPITVTNKEMTRFFMRTDQCVELIFKASKYAKDAEIFILKMFAVKIGDLAEAYLSIKGSELSPKIIGSRKGEKIHEDLLQDVTDTNLLESDSLYVKLSPFAQKKNIRRLKKAGFKPVQRKSFRSNEETQLLSNEEILKTLNKELDGLV